MTEDERDNLLNVTPHCEFAGNAVYEFLPALGETLWYRMVAGASVPRYLRIRSRQSLAVKTSIDIGNLRPTMSYNLEPARQ